MQLIIVRINMEDAATKISLEVRGMEYLAMGLFGYVLLFIIVTNTMKIGTREALQEFKDELLEEFNKQREE